MRRFDLVVIGAGSGNMLVDDSWSDKQVAIVEHDLFGGTCLNRGCIPSKMLAYTAEVIDLVQESGTYDVDATYEGLRWSDLQKRVFDRLDQAASEGQQGREESGFVTVYTGTARFTGPRRLVVEGADGGSEEFEAEQVVIAAGGRPIVPPPVRDSGLPYLTSDTNMRVDAPPRRLAIIGGGYIAAEQAHVFHAAGSEVVVVEAEDTLLSGFDETVTARFTELAAEQYEVHLGRRVERLEGEPGALRLVLDDDTVVEATELLVAAGRAPNSDRLDLDAAGIDVHDDGRISVDEYQRASAEGVWALGDISSPVPLKHVANREAEAVAHNLAHPDDLRRVDHDLVPAAVFTNPQIGSVGRTEAQCREEGLDYTSAQVEFGDVAYGWAMEDRTGLCKILAEKGSGRILGAHIMGPQSPTMIHILSVAMTFGVDAKALSSKPYWVHPALAEVVDNALRNLEV